MCRCSFCLPRRGSYGASDWIHWTGHHGTPHGEESPEGGIPPRRPQPKPRARGRARPGGRESRHIDAALSIMVGGEKVVFDAVLPIFQAMGRTITRLGPLGSGGFTKLANQIIVAVNLTALAEALTLAKKAGLDRELTLTALAGGLAGSRCLDQKRPNYVANTYPPGFKIDLHYKDLGLIMDSARALGDFLERQLGTRPRQAFGGAQYVHHRWLMEPWGCFVAEEDNAKIVGAALAVTWGTVGILGPVAVLTNYQNQTIGQQLIRASEEFFEENKAALHGCVTYPTSPKHLFLFHKFGYRPKALTAVMSRAIDRAPARAAVPKPGKAALAVRRFSSLEETKKKATLARMHRITNAICRGMDLSKEVEIVDGLALGDTLLLERGRDLAGFAIYHTPGVSEAPSGALYVKFLAIDPPQRKVEHLTEFVAALETLGQELGIQRVILPVYSRYWLAYNTLVQCGYQIDFTMIRMQRGRQEDYEAPTHLVLDDWR